MVRHIVVGILKDFYKSLCVRIKYTLLTARVRVWLLYRNLGLWSCIKFFLRLPIHFLNFLFFSFFFFFTSLLSISIFIFNGFVFMYYYFISFFFLILDFIFFFLSPLLSFVIFVFRRTKFRVLVFFFTYFGIGFSHVFFSVISFILRFFILLFFLSIAFSVPFFYSGWLFTELSFVLSYNSLYRNIVGSVWYSSYWWYLRIWFVYLLIYVLFPGSRFLILENWIFIIGFPIILFIFDFFPVFEIVQRDVGMRKRRFSIETGSAWNLRDFGLTTLYFFFPRFLVRPYGESVETTISDSYSVPTQYDNAAKQQFRTQKWRRKNFYNSPRFFARNNPEAGNYKGITLYGYDEIMRLAIGDDKGLPIPSWWTYRHESPIYVMNVAELNARSNDLFSLVPIHLMYFDEQYYLRMLDDIDRGLFDGTSLKFQFSDDGSFHFGPSYRADLFGQGFYSLKIEKDVSLSSGKKT